MAEKNYRTISEKYRRLLVLADNLTRSVESGDRAVEIQAAGASREFLSKYLSDLEE
jgi:hypothetical protein